MVLVELGAKGFEHGYEVRGSSFRRDLAIIKLVLDTGHAHDDLQAT